MKKCDTITIESYEESVSQLSNRVAYSHIIDEMYNRGLSVYDAVDVVNKDVITVSEINQLNLKCGFVLNTMISKYNLDNPIDRCLFSNEFIEKEIDLSVLKLEIISKGLDAQGKKKKHTGRLMDREKIKTDLTIKKLKSIKNTEDFKKFINE